LALAGGIWADRWAVDEADVFIVDKLKRAAQPNTEASEGCGAFRN
jgi:hypothetical protein